MNPRRSETSAGTRNPVFGSIAHRRRRTVLDTLLRWGPPLSERQLAEHLAAVEQGTPSPGRPEVEAIQTDLTHAHLPRLEAAGLVRWDRDDAIVRTTSHPALDDPRFRLLLETEREGLDDALSALAHEHRRLALTVLKDEGPTSLPTLARDALRRGPDDLGLGTGTVDDLVVSLAHVHLPKLAEADLIAYDPETGHVTYSDHPALETVFEIIFEPDNHLAEAYDEFFAGLGTAFDQLGRDPSVEADWPNSWRDPYHG